MVKAIHLLVLGGLLVCWYCQEHRFTISFCRVVLLLHLMPRRVIVRDSRQNASA